MWPWLHKDISSNDILRAVPHGHHEFCMQFWLARKDSHAVSYFKELKRGNVVIWGSYIPGFLCSTILRVCSEILIFRRDIQLSKQVLQLTKGSENPTLCASTYGCSDCTFIKLESPSFCPLLYPNHIISTASGALVVVVVWDGSHPSIPSIHPQVNFWVF